MTNTPRDENITGASLSGSSGDANRTYTLAYSGVDSSTMTIHVQGAFLYPNVDYTLASGIVTFIGAVWDDQLIRLQYYTWSNSNLGTGTPRYATTQQLADVCGISMTTPSWDVGSSATNEDLGTVSGSGAELYFDHVNIIAGSYTLYTGGTTAATAATAMTETTHYTVDKTKGTVTITAAGATLVGVTNHVFAKYNYVHPSYNFSDAYLSTVLTRAEKELDNMVATTFRDGSSTNPDYPVALKESQMTQGLFNLVYQTENKPVIDVATTLDGTITSGASTLAVAAGDGALFPLSGYIIIDTEVIQYTGVSTDTLTGLTRGALGSTAAAHTDGAEIHTTIAQISGESQGSSPTWQTLSWNDEMYANTLGFIEIYNTDALGVGSISPNLYARADTRNRVRLTYLYGHDSIPEDITRLALLLAKRMLMRDVVGKATLSGRNEFNPSLITVDDAEIEEIVSSYVEIPMLNT